MREQEKQIITRRDRQLDTTTEIVVPVVHLNGTSRESLIEQREQVLDHLRAVQDALVRCSPNGRDYYPVGPDLMRRAEEQHLARKIAVHTLIADFEYELEAIVDDEFDGDRS